MSDARLPSPIRTQACALRPLQGALLRMRLHRVLGPV